DRSLPAQVIYNLRRYIKMNVLEGCGVFSSDKTSGKPDLNMALCLYMLPEQSKDPKIQQYIEIIHDLGLETKNEFNYLRSQPYKFDRIQQMATLLKREQERLNIAGFWKNGIELFALVSEQLLAVAYE